jgi:hypothetical protein
MLKCQMILRTPSKIACLHQTARLLGPRLSVLQIQSGCLCTGTALHTHSLSSATFLSSAFITLPVLLALTLLAQVERSAAARGQQLRPPVKCPRKCRALHWRRLLARSPVGPAALAVHRRCCAPPPICPAPIPHPPPASCTPLPPPCPAAIGVPLLRFPGGGAATPRGAGPPGPPAPRQYCRACVPMLTLPPSLPPSRSPACRCMCRHGRAAVRAAPRAAPLAGRAATQRSGRQVRAAGLPGDAAAALVGSVLRRGPGPCRSRRNEELHRGQRTG